MEPGIPTSIMKKKPNLAISPLATAGRLASVPRTSERDAAAEDEEPAAPPPTLDLARRRSVTIVTPRESVSSVCSCCASAPCRPRGTLSAWLRRAGRTYKVQFIDELSRPCTVDGANGALVKGGHQFFCACFCGLRYGCVHAWGMRVCVCVCVWCVVVVVCGVWCVVVVVCVCAYTALGHLYWGAGCMLLHLRRKRMNTLGDDQTVSQGMAQSQPVSWTA